MSLPPSRPLLRGEDHGDSIRVDPAIVGASGDRWIEPFLRANGPQLRRLELEPEIRTDRGVSLTLRPHNRIGAVPILSPSTRKVVAGLLVSPRFRWAALGAVMAGVGFEQEPQLGGAPHVPGSARDVPPWLLAAPVLNRLEKLLSHRTRGFVERTEDRQSPRGHVDWGRWARSYVPRGHWTTLPCTFSDPDDDPALMAHVRWTLARLDDELVSTGESMPARALRERVRALTLEVGAGPARRPTVWTAPAMSGWLANALEAMGWVAENRGLGGARSLDGLAWDLEIDALWEAWVSAFARTIAPQLGMSWLGREAVRQRLDWKGGPRSMGALIPDTGLRGARRLVWIDAKYKFHLALLARHGWAGLADAVRESHRADLHQALAYAAIADVETVDTVLAYPALVEDSRPFTTIATLSVGRRRVRLILASLPFGFTSPAAQQLASGRWRELLAA